MDEDNNNGFTIALNDVDYRGYGVESKALVVAMFSYTVELAGVTLVKWFRLRPPSYTPLLIPPWLFHHIYTPLADVSNHTVIVIRCCIL